MIRPEGFTHCKEYECGRRLSSRQTEVKLNVRRRQSQILLCVLRPRVVVVERESILPPHSLYPTVSKHRITSRGQAFRKHVFVIIWTNQHTTIEVMPLNARDHHNHTSLLRHIRITHGSPSGWGRQRTRSMSLWKKPRRHSFLLDTRIYTYISKLVITSGPKM